MLSTLGATLIHLELYRFGSKPQTFGCTEVEERQSVRLAEPTVTIWESPTKFVPKRKRACGSVSITVVWMQSRNETTTSCVARASALVCYVELKWFQRFISAPASGRSRRTTRPLTRELLSRIIAFSSIRRRFLIKLCTSNNFPFYRRHRSFGKIAICCCLYRWHHRHLINGERTFNAHRQETIASEECWFEFHIKISSLFVRPKNSSRTWLYQAAHKWRKRIRQKTRGCII